MPRAPLPGAAGAPHGRPGPGRPRVRLVDEDASILDDAGLPARVGQEGVRGRRGAERAAAPDLRGLVRRRPQKDKVEAEPGYKRIPDPDPKKIDKDAVAAGLRKDGFTHVLVTRLVSVEDRETYHPPSTMTVGVGFGGYPGYYGGWYPYMSMSYGYVTSPGYTTVNTVVGL